MSKIKVSLIGSKKDGYTLQVSNNTDDFLWDVSLIEEELLGIYKAIQKKLKL